jgi:hypothetical protein
VVLTIYGAENDKPGANAASGITHLNLAKRALPARFNNFRHASQLAKYSN